jgi:hypothetical protein
MFVDKDTSDNFCSTRSIFEAKCVKNATNLITPILSHFLILTMSVNIASLQYCIQYGVIDILTTETYLKIRSNF